MAVCPNKNLPEWQALEARVGAFEAFRDFMEHDGEIRSPEVVERKLSARKGERFQMVALSDYQTTITREKMQIMLDNLVAKFPEKDIATEIVFEPDQNWKGKVEQEGDSFTGRKTVKINMAHATLDTPMHEFGHIFLDMIKSSNQRLYSTLKRLVPRAKEASGLLDRIKNDPYYSTRSPEEQIEELIVEMMGRNAAGLVETEETKSLLDELWEAIKEFLKDIIQAGQAVDVINIKHTTTVADLANFLAHRDLQLIEGSIAKPAIESHVAARIQELDTFQKQVDLLSSYREDEIEFLSTINSSTGIDIMNIYGVVDKSTGDKIKKYTEDAHYSARKYLISITPTYTEDGQTFNSFETDNRNVFSYIHSATGTPEEVWEQVKSNPEWKRWRWVTKTIPDVDNTMINFIARIQRGTDSATSIHGNVLSITKRGITRFISGSYNDFIHRAFYDPKGLEAKFLVGNNDGFSVIFRTDHATQNVGRVGLSFGENLQRLVDKVNTKANDLKSLLEEAKRGRQGTLTHRFKVQGHLADGTPKVEEIGVDTTFRQGDVYVVFNSSIWGFSDASFIHDFNSNDVVVWESAELNPEPVLFEDLPEGVRVWTVDQIDYDPDKMGKNEYYRDPDTGEWFKVKAKTPPTKVQLRPGVDGAILKNGTGGLTRYYGFVTGYENGKVKIKFKNRSTTPTGKQHDSEHLYDPADLQIVKSQGHGSTVMPRVVDAITSLNYATGYTTISFGSAAGESISRADSAMRDLMYQASARSLFGDDYTLLITPVDQLSDEDKKKYPKGKPQMSTIVVPESFKPGFKAQSLYQMKTTGIEPSFSNPLNEGSLAVETLKQQPVESDLNLEATDQVMAIEIANKLSEQLGIDYQIVTAEQAREITKDATNPWNGQKAFFVGGTVYFVGDNMSVNDVLHEFSHPLIRSIGKTNPSLFNKLYDQLAGTEEGRAIIAEVRENYPLLDDSKDFFKEEVLVRALEHRSKSLLDNKGSSNGFTKVIKNLLYALKQFLRSVFGQSATVAKLDSSTTLQELAEMLVNGGQFEIDVEHVSQEDVVAYMEDTKQYMEDLMKAPPEELQVMINQIYDISTRHINQLQNDGNYTALAELLTEEYAKGELDEMRANVQAYQTSIANETNRLKNDMEYTKKQVTALVNSMFRLGTVMDKILFHMQDLAQEAKTPQDAIDNMAKAHYYQGLVDYWSSFIQEAKEALNDPKNNIPVNSPVLQLIRNIEGSIERINDISNNMAADGARDTLYQELEPMHESVKKRYDHIISTLREKGAPQSRIDKYYKEYHGVTEAEHAELKALQKLKKEKGLLTRDESGRLQQLERASAEGLALSPEKIEHILKGRMGDSNFFNSYLEGYMYSTDPVVGGLALYVKNHMNEVMLTSQNKLNDFMKDMRPLLEKAGYNEFRLGELGEKVGFVDTVGKRDEAGKLIKREVWTLLNQFKDYRYEVDKLKDDVEQAQIEHARTGTEESKKAMIDAVAAQKIHMRKYFHQRYVDSYYNRRRLFEGDVIGEEAGFLRDNLFERMRSLTEPAKSEDDYMQVSGELDELWREYRQMHSMYYEDGSLKVDKPEEGVYDASVAQRLRQYRDETREFYDWKLRENAFQSALRSYEQELVNKDLDPAEYAQRRQDWIEKNTRRQIKPEFYEERERILNAISAIMSKIPADLRKEVDESEIQKKILDLMSSYRDEDKQPDGTVMSAGTLAEIKALEEQLDEIRANRVGRSGLSPAEWERLQELNDIDQPTDAEVQERAFLYNKRDRYGLSKGDKADLDALYNELRLLQHKEATDYYVDIFNYWLTKLDTNKLHRATGLRHITKLGANKVLQPNVINDLMGQSPEFAAWFRANHILRGRFNKDANGGKGGVEMTWERTAAWSVVQPNDQSYLESTQIKDETGKVIDTVPGVPVSRFWARVVKPEFETRRIVGVTVDNRGQWLPKTMEQGAADDRYINEKYEKLRENDPDMFAVLEKLKEHHLRNQEGLPHKSKLYYDFPRYRKKALEAVQTGNRLQRYAQRVREFIRAGKDDADRYGYNYKDEYNLVRADMFDNEITDVPIHGLFDIDLNDVSTDITHNMMRYMMSAERQKQLIRISPFARSVQRVVNDPKNAVKEMDKINKFNLIHRGVKSYLTKKGKGVRQAAVNNFIEREFEGQRMAGYTKDIPLLNNVANLMFKRASFSFFALNIPSALKNSYGAKFQGLIEASAGEYMNHISFQKGNGWSYKTMAELSFTGQLYAKGPKKLNQQIVEIFDPSQGRFEEKFGESISRNIASDAANFSWLYNFRKWVELQATLQIFGGMMYHQKVKQTLPDGTVKEINYMDAWELRDEKIQLKEGVDPEWGITYDEEGRAVVGKEFNRFKNTMQQVMNNLQGAYAQFDQPEAQRYLMFRFLSYLRRYFTTMTINRFGHSGRFWDPKPRMNPGLQDIHMGFYVQFLNTVKDTVVSLGRNLPYMTTEEKRAALKMMTEVGLLVATMLTMSLVFGWDPDDDQKYEKLRARSGALPFPFVADDPDREFNGWGFLENHMLFLLMNIRAENEQFLPLPGYGLDDYSAMLDLKSIAFGPTAKTYKELIEDAVDIVQGDESAYYKRQVGPYEWQQQGGAKIWAHLGVTLGLTGSSLDPSKAIKGWQSVQARAR